MWCLRRTRRNRVRSARPSARTNSHAEPPESQEAQAARAAVRSLAAESAAREPRAAVLECPFARAQTASPAPLVARQAQEGQEALPEPPEQGAQAALGLPVPPGSPPRGRQRPGSP